MPELLAPSTIRVTRLRAADVAMATRLFVLMAAVFEESCEELGDEHVSRMLATDGFWALAAFDGTTLVGGLTAHTLPMTRSSTSEVFIFDIAVHGAHQRRGVGRSLIGELRREAAAQGTHDVFVAADTEDTHALEFYRALGGKASEATFFTFARSR